MILKDTSSPLMDKQELADYLKISFDERRAAKKAAGARLLPRVGSAAYCVGTRIKVDAWLLDRAPAMLHLMPSPFSSNLLSAGSGFF